MPSTAGVTSRLTDVDVGAGRHQQHEAALGDGAATDHHDTTVRQVGPTR